MSVVPSWAVMWTLAAGVYAGCKWITWRAAAPAGTRFRHAAYLVAWPGLDAPRFFDPRPEAQPVRGGEWLAGAISLACGACLFFAAARLTAADLYITGWIGMVGLVLMLHFGAFHLLSCGWRTAGVRARPLMNRPLAASSLADFWGRRWNTAFRDLTHRFLFQPLAARLGSRWAILGGQVVVPVAQRHQPFWVWNAALNQLYMSSYVILAGRHPGVKRFLATERNGGRTNAWQRCQAFVSDKALG